MKLFILPLGLLVSIFAYSQPQDTAYLKLIGERMRQLQPNGIVYYSDKPRKGTLDQILKVAPRQLTQLRKKGLLFTDSENKYIISSLKKAFYAIQKDSLFPSSKRLHSDSIVAFVENKFRGTIDSLRRSLDTLAAARYYAEKRGWAFSFSDPIYLRKRKILIYYFMYYFNSSGEEVVWVCEKKDLFMVECFKWLTI